MLRSQSRKAAPNRAPCQMQAALLYTNSPLIGSFQARHVNRIADFFGSFSAIHQLPVGPRVRPANLNRPLNCPSLPGPRLAASLGVLILPRIG